MKQYRRIIMAAAAAVSMLFLILNAKEALVFAVDAVKLCTDSLIPSLFPFMFFAILLNGALTGCRIPFMYPIRVVCGIPKGSEILFLLSILGGYPVGAQMISNTYSSGNLKKEDAQRMLGFCNNAGPAFIFGVVGPLFDSGIVPALLWFIQILAAILTGAFLSGYSSDEIIISRQRQIAPTEALEKSIKTMSFICGWVLLFRIIVGFTEQHLLFRLPDYISIILAGTLELTNGCIALTGIKNSGARFILSSLFLAAGGLCIALQTKSAAKTLNMKQYITGKCIQILLSVMLAYVTQFFIFSTDNRFVLHNLGAVIAVLLVFTAAITIYRKKTVAFCNELIYN